MRHSALADMIHESPAAGERIRSPSLHAGKQQEAFLKKTTGIKTAQQAVMDSSSVTGKIKHSPSQQSSCRPGGGCDNEEPKPPGYQPCDGEQARQRGPRDSVR
jgi:hypothetical protein